MSINIDCKKEVSIFSEDVSFIICELNPLHFGHELLISEAKKNSSAVVCIMSGNFVQRGELAIIDKWARTELALKAGANLVVELPLSWSCSGAERFAYGGVSLADSFNIGGKLYFGSEAGETCELDEIAKTLVSNSFNESISLEMSKGNITFAKAREKVICTLLGANSAESISKPNNILAIEYIKAINQLDSPLVAKTVKRIGAGHDKTAMQNELHSASELREMIYSSKDMTNFLPAYTSQAMEALTFQGLAPVTIDTLELAILSRLRSMTAKDFLTIPDVNEGLENKMVSAADNARSLDELYSLVKSKRYAHSRIRRIVLSAFLGIEANLAAPPYIRVLGMDSIGEQLIKASKPKLPYVFKSSDLEKQSLNSQKTFELEAKSDDIYALAYPVPQKGGLDYTKKIIRI